MEQGSTEYRNETEGYPSRIEPTTSSSYWYRPLSKDALIVVVSVIVGAMLLIAFGYTITLVVGVAAVFGLGLLMFIKQPDGIYGDDISPPVNAPLLSKRTPEHALSEEGAGPEEHHEAY